MAKNYRTEVMNLALKQTKMNLNENVHKSLVVPNLFCPIVQKIFQIICSEIFYQY